MINRLINAFFWRLGYKKRNKIAETNKLNENKWIQKLAIDVIFDVGASDGGFARKIKNIFPDAVLYSFEALPDSFRKLKEKCGHLSNFHPIHTALSNKNGIIDFYYCEHNTGSSSMLQMAEIHKEAYPHTAQNKLIQVDAILLDDFIKTIDIKEKSVMLKLDVQGAEKMVLEGATQTLQLVKLIICEINFVETYNGCVLYDELNTILVNNGFKLVGMENISRNNIDGTFLQADAYFLKK